MTRVLDAQDLKAANTDLSSVYMQQGYVVCRQVIPVEKIDRLIRDYRATIIPSRHPFFRQNTCRYEQNLLTAHGFVKQSFLDIHDSRKYAAFSELVKDILFDDNLQHCLTNATKANDHHLMQSMLFDANAETEPHQDNWYLDTVPNGHLIAAWIALEDIDERAGRFYLIPGSQKEDFIGQEHKTLRVSTWKERIRRYVDKNASLIDAPALKKGDVILWNSATVHGALKTKDPAFSRKSLTAHFVPDGFAYGNTFVTKSFTQFKTYNGKKFYANQPDYSLYQWAKNEVKQSVYDSPHMMRAFRFIQKLINNF